MKVLVAEDDRVTRTRIAALLKKWGHEVVEAADGKKAWKIFRRERSVNFVISDWLMPEMDGLELLRKIRAHENRRGYVYAIVLTSRSATGDLVEAMNAGADDFVGKPFENEELHARLRAGQRVVELERQLDHQNRSLKKANERMRVDLEAAARIQHSFLPERLPKVKQAEFAWRYEPSEELGGDTLNIIPLDSRRIALYVLDVCGHGVPAALLAVNLSRVLMNSGHLPHNGDSPQETAGEIPEPDQPARVAAMLNQMFQFSLNNQQYFTLIYGILDLETREFRYTSAGHPGPIVVSEGKASIQEPMPPAVGFFPEATFTEKTLKLKPHDRLYLYSDGIYEVHDSEGEEFGESRMAELLASKMDRSLDESLRSILEAAHSWTKRAPLPDDASLVALEVE